MGVKPTRVISTAVSLIIVLDCYFYYGSHIWLVLIKQAPEFMNVAYTFTGTLFISLFLGCLILLREMPHQLGINYLSCGKLVSLIFLLVWILDTSAYFIGKKFGRKQLYPRISPKKTWAGTVWGLFFTIIGAFLAKIIYIDFLTFFHAAALGIIVGITGQVGDLVESALKRTAEIKDSSTIIPGHGGVLDRFDSLIFTAPFAYLYVNYFVF